MFVHRDSGSQTSDDCHVFYVPSNPVNGNTPVHFTFPPLGVHDYDPTWSPVLGREIAFDRCDERILRKGVPGINPDTSEILITRSGDGCPYVGDGTPSFSPAGDTVAFTRYDYVANAYNIWKIALTGGTVIQLTTGANVFDRFPQWSPDGNWIYFQRRFGVGPYGIYRVSAQGGTVETIYSDTSGYRVKNPATSPDGQVVTLGRSTTTTSDVPSFSQTIDPRLAPVPEKMAIASYNAFLGGSGEGLFPQLSPDGTRLAFFARPPGTTGGDELWAVRRNMNLPPVLTQIGGSNEQFQVEEGDPITFTISATDPEGNPLRYEAFFLKLGMNFNPATRTFSWTPPPGAANKTYHVKFLTTQTDSAGGADWQVVRIKVVPPAPGPGRLSSAFAVASGLANPSRGPFLLATAGFPGREVVLTVLDVSGRVVFREQHVPGKPFLWGAKSSSGRLLSPGVYFYRLQAGDQVRTGKWVLVR